MAELRFIFKNSQNNQIDMCAGNFGTVSVKKVANFKLIFRPIFMNENNFVSTSKPTNFFIKKTFLKTFFLKNSMFFILISILFHGK